MFFSYLAANIKTVFKTWIVLTLLNQVVFFGACLAPYCILASIPHVSLITFGIMYLLYKPELDLQKKKKQEKIIAKKIEMDRFFNEPKKVAVIIENEVNEVKATRVNADKMLKEFEIDGEAIDTKITRLQKELADCKAKKESDNRLIQTAKNGDIRTPMTF